MKNIVNSFKINTLSSRKGLGVGLTCLFLTLGVGYAWGDTYCKAASVKYNTGSDQWWEVTSSTKALGTVTTFKLKGFWLQLTGGNVCQGAKMYYSVTGGVNNNYNIQDPQNWNADPKHFQTESMNIDVLSGLSCGNHTLNIWFEGHGQSDCKSLWYSNNSNNYKMSFTIPGFTTTSTSKNFGSVNTGSNSSATISFGNHYGTTLTTRNCSITDTNSGDFSVTSISETGVTVQFAPSAGGSRSATLTITDAHSKTCTISLSGTGVVAPSLSLSAPSSGVRGESVTLTATVLNASTPTIVYQYSTSNTFASSVTDIASTTSTSQSWTIPSGTAGTTYYLRAKMTISGTTYYSSILTLTAYGKKVIHVKNTNNWGTLYLYAWDSSDNKLNGNWPGKTGTGSNGLSCTNTGGQWWDVVITSQISGFILNANVSGDANQTADLSYSTYTNDRCLAIGTGSGKKTLSNTAVTCPSEPTDVTTTAAPTASTNTGMTIKGSIGGNGNDKITSYGFYYGTTTACSTQAQVGTTDKTGDFTKALTGLTAGTTYFFKAYATNGQGTTYGTRYSYKIPYSVTVSKSTGCESITPSAGSYYYNAGFTVTAVAATGYTFNAWSKTNGNLSGASEPSTGTNTVTFTPTANNATITATYTPKTTSITLSQTGAATTGSVTTRTGTYNAAMPAITGSGSLPIAPNGYCFMGYYGSANGEGTKYYNADGSSAHTWDQVGATATLYAYFKKAEITVAVDQSIFSPVDAGGESWVTATPTVYPTPVAPTTICWALLYDDENPVPSGHDPVELADNKVKFNLAGLAAGNYKIRATLRTGSSCAAGTLLSTYDKTITIATNFKVTVRYMCGDEAIKDTIMVDALATDWTTISAPNIFGYTFTTWDLGDGGITRNPSTALTQQTNFQFKATYNGTLTAVYRKKGIIYFKKPSDWTGTKVYYYNLGSSDKWHTTEGDWNKRGIYTKDISWGAHEMTRITGTSIYYYDYEAENNAAANPGDYIAFADASQDGYEPIYNCKASYPIQYTKGFNAGTPMFVCTNYSNSDIWNGVKYYNHGYWTKYERGSGYTLKIYNKKESGRQEIKSVPFVTDGTNNFEIPFKATVDLDAATTYGFKIVRDDNLYFKNDNDGTMTYSSHDGWPFLYDGSDGSACGITTTAAGSYVFTLSYFNTGNNADHELRVSVTYPAAVNDFQVYYRDASKPAHPSRMIKARAGGVDTISFFVHKTNTPMLKARKVTNASTMTWGALNIAGAASMSLSVDSSAVYNFKVTQGSAGVISSIVNIGAYTGEYYIRCGALNSKWDNYTIDGDHKMTYSSFSESDANAFGEKFSHYKAKWCPRGTNVKFVIANDYSPCISDTLIQDVGNPYNNIYLDDAWGRPDGELKADGYDGSGNITTSETGDRYSANIRFMWNRKTNKISRAYVASSTNPERLFLVLRGNYAIKGTDNENIEDEGTGIPSVILQDDQNWIYEEILYIKPNTRFKLYACYAQVTASPNGAQYFRGSYNSNAFSGDDGVDSENSVVLISGNGEYQKARVLYDFKTNRLICAWLPSETAVSGTLNINADVMIIREHQEAAQYLSFADADSKLTGVKTVYGVMKFNRWVLNNRKQTGDHDPLDVGDQKSIFERSLYFISFPFDVRVSDIFGFGQYGTHWIIEYYDGLTRAKNGFWIDSPPNWKYVTNPNGYTLKANEGYILALDLDQMKYNNTDFWPNDIQTVELFFPSTAKLETLKQTTCTIPALSSDYKCTINRTGEDGDRRVKDSYWRCIGVPSLNLYNSALTDGSGNTITWKTDYTWHENESEFPFIYMWNKGDNTLTPQATSNFTFLPMHSYLVQNGGQIVWTNVSAKSSIVARRENDYQQIDYNWRLELAKDSQMVDQAYIRMSNLEQVTDTFDFGQDLSKEFNATRSNIYSFIGYEKAAANSMPLKTEQTTIVAIGLNIITAGEYTLGMPDGTDGVGVTLVDSETGTRTNLSAGMTYTVTLAAGDYTSRFYLEISPVKETPTGLEQSPITNHQSPIKKLLIDGILYIVRDGKIFDARGVMVK